MMLLVTGGLLTRGLLRSRAAEPGFETRAIYRVTADFGETTSKAIARQRRLLERLRTLPAVSGVAEGTLPLLGTWTPPIVVDGVQGRTLGSYAAESYMETLGIPLLRGRTFTPQEIDRNAPLALISEATAHRFWPSSDPIGRKFQLDMNFRGEMREFSVIGVVKDVRFANLTRLDPAHVYLTPKAGDFPDALVRIQGDSRTALTAIRGAIQATDPSLMPSLFLMNMEDGPVWLQKIQVQAMALATLTLAGLALLLAGVGIYGVMSFLVSQRTREIGIRMAMGAAAGDVVRSVVTDGLRPVFVGIALGIAAGAGLSTVLHATLQFPGSMDFLYGVSFYDPLTFLGLSGFLLGVAALASAAPARRASRVDPMVALRYE
jgi:putative ABC transport system permease protein